MIVWASLMMVSAVHSKHKGGLLVRHLEGGCLPCLVDCNAEHPGLRLRRLWGREELEHEATGRLDQGHPALLPAARGVQPIPCHQTDQTLPFAFHNCLRASALSFLAQHPW